MLGTYAHLIRIALASQHSRVIRAACNRCYLLGDASNLGRLGAVCSRFQAKFPCWCVLLRKLNEVYVVLSMTVNKPYSASPNENSSFFSVKVVIRWCQTRSHHTIDDECVVCAARNHHGLRLHLENLRSGNLCTVNKQYPITTPTEQLAILVLPLPS